MRYTAAVLILLLISTAAGFPAGEGGGSSSDTEESTLSTILMITVVVGVAALLVGDILADNATDSQDALSGIPVAADTLNETGIDWTKILNEDDTAELPLVAVAVFQMSSGRDLAHYFTALMAPGEETYYLVYGPPVSLGSIPSSEAAATGFTFVNCDWFITGDNTGLQLFQRGQSDPLWTFPGENPDSTFIRSASSSFLDFAAGQ